MCKIFKKYWIALCFSIMFVFLTMTSTWVREVVSLPNVFYKGITLLIYLPFVAAVFWKLIYDIKNFKTNIKKPINIVYYSLAAYYVLISAYRFITSLEIKENLYYTIILFGSIAIYMQLSENKIIIDKVNIQKNIVLISAVVAASRLVNYFLVGPIFLSYPINMNIMTGLNILTLPFLVDFYKTIESKKSKAFALCLIALIFIETLTSSARMMCALLLVALAVQIVVNFKNKKVFKRILTTCLCALLVIVVMFVGSVKNTRYAIYREFDFVKTIAMAIDEAMGTEMSNDDLDEEQEKIEAVEQIQRSDSMRKDLMNMGLEEFKKNPLFGTGNVTFLYPVGEYVFEQSSHNFLIEALNCYGIIGILLIVVFIILALYKSKVFSRKNKGPWQDKISVLLTFGIFFAMGCLQPLVFNILVCPTFMLLFANYHNTAQDNLIK